MKLIDELALRGNEQVIDLGCGDGILTRQIAERVPGGSVLGVDSSPSMINTAKKLEGGNLRFEVLNINDLTFEGEFDVAFSNAALHWVKDHGRLLDHVRSGLRAGGRIRFNFAGDGNCSNFFAVAREVMELPRYRRYFEQAQWPWFMPTLEEYEFLVRSKKFSEHRTWTENADRFFTEDELLSWIDQPSLVPLLALVHENDKKGMRDLVVEKMKERTRAPDGSYFETFRRMNLSATK